MTTITMYRITYTDGTPTIRADSWQAVDRIIRRKYHTSTPIYVEIDDEVPTWWAYRDDVHAADDMDTHVIEIVQIGGAQ